MRPLKSTLANTILVLLIISNNILTFSPIRTKRVLRFASQCHTALRSAKFTIQPGEGIAIHDRLAAATALFAGRALCGRNTLAAILTNLRAFNLTMHPDEAGVLAIAVGLTSQRCGGGIEFGAVGVLKSWFDALTGVASTAVGVVDEGARCGWHCVSAMGHHGNSE